MQILITHDGTARTRVLQFSRLRLAVIFVVAMALLMMASGAIYHFVFLKAAREGWPIVSQLVKLVVRDEIAQRDRFMRENLDAMAQQVGEWAEAGGRTICAGASIPLFTSQRFPSVSSVPAHGNSPLTGSQSSSAVLTALSRAA